MTSSFASIAETLKLPALSKADITALKSLQREWDRHTRRMELLRPERVLADQKAAFHAFLNDPSEDNEQRLAVLADERLTAKRHGLLHEAHAQRQRILNEKAAGIVRPVLESMQQPLQAELAAREEAALAEGWNKRTDERCIEVREALALVVHGLRTLAEATSITHVQEWSPKDLVAPLLPQAAEAAA